MTPILALARAVDFAARRHTDQRRKGARAEPYFNHLAEVAQMLAEATGGREPDLVIAGLLHDILEDTDTRRDEIEAGFGSVVAALVAEVTDDKSLPKQERKQLQVLQAPHKSNGAKMIKLADKISNLRTLILSPPANWSLERQSGYLDWAQAVVAGCRGVNPYLEDQFDQSYREGMAHLAGALPCTSREVPFP